MSERKSIDEILSKYSRKISQNISSEENTGNVSKEYTTFKKDMVPRLSRYENFVKAFSFLKLSVGKLNFLNCCGVKSSLMSIIDFPDSVKTLHPPLGIFAYLTFSINGC